MKKIVSSLICLAMISTLCSCSSSVANNKSRATNEIKVVSSNKTVTKDVSFTVMDLQSKPIEGAKIVIISANGDVISVESSDKSGKVQKKVIVPIDKKYSWADPNKIEQRGTLTAIVFKEGYCEQVVFEVPVSSAEAGTSVYLNPVVPGKRNEPVVQLGNNHHLEIISLVEKYKQYLK